MSEIGTDLKDVRKKLEREARAALKSAGCDIPTSEMTKEQRRRYEAITRKFRRAMARASETTYKVPPERAKFDELMGRAAAVYLSQNPAHQDAVANIAALLLSDPKVATVIKRRLDARVKEIAEVLVRRKSAGEREAGRGATPMGGVERPGGLTASASI